MDEMKIESKFLTSIASKLIRRLIRSKTGYDVAVQLNKIHITSVDGKTRAHLDVDLELDKEDLQNIVKSAGL